MSEHNSDRVHELRRVISSTNLLCALYMYLLQIPDKNTDQVKTKNDYNPTSEKHQGIFTYIIPQYSTVFMPSNENLCRDRNKTLRFPLNAFMCTLNPDGW